MTDAKELVSQFSYDPFTGEFRHLRGRNKGRVAGTHKGATNGSWSIWFMGKAHLAHRLAWLSMTSRWPDEEIDHINGNRLDNRWDNLRAATRQENACNTKRPKNNTSGYKGVYRCSTTKRWRAEIICMGKKYRLGRYSNIKDAHRAYADAAKRLHREFARVT